MAIRQIEDLKNRAFKAYENGFYGAAFYLAEKAEKIATALSPEGLLIFDFVNWIPGLRFDCQRQIFNELKRALNGSNVNLTPDNVYKILDEHRPPSWQEYHNIKEKDNAVF
ncbi:hypothetical protein KY325_01550 [Candidatus Woesearchaeota archaeon]|nr:hypothetical protein [Candidatus Woesearchaeota archaeon]MBW3017823.1 hypothetical protein [Candidatus Woesearchaeota archaeon]